MGTQYEHPNGLDEHGRRAWDICVEEFGPRMRAVDTLLLEQFCRLSDLLPKLNERAANGEKGSMIELGIAMDKLLTYSARLGLSYADRLKLKIEKPETEKPKETAPKRRRSSLDNLTPESLGIVQPEQFRSGVTK